MIIHGIGTDIVNVTRIRKLIDKYGSHFIDKVLTADEKNQYENLIDSKKISYMAKRFAAKESVAKALGTGITKNCTLHDIKIDNDYLGKPIVYLSSKTEKRILETSLYNIFLSISDEKAFVIAYCIIVKFTGITDNACMTS